MAFRVCGMLAIILVFGDASVQLFACLLLLLLLLQSIRIPRHDIPSVWQPHRRTNKKLSIPAIPIEGPTAKPGGDMEANKRLIGRQRMWLRMQGRIRLPQAGQDLMEVVASTCRRS